MPLLSAPDAATLVRKIQTRSPLPLPRKTTARYPGRQLAATSSAWPWPGRHRSLRVDPARPPPVAPPCVWIRPGRCHFLRWTPTWAPPLPARASAQGARRLLPAALRPPPCSSARPRPTRGCHHPVTGPPSDSGCGSPDGYPLPMRVAGVGNFETRSGWRVRMTGNLSLAGAGVFFYPPPGFPPVAIPSGSGRRRLVVTPQVFN
jgi:hypothetical protein